METACKHCIFLKNKNCVLSKLENLVYYYLEDDNPQVSGLCRYMRNVYWPEYADHPDATLDNLIDAVNEEVKLKYSAVITYDILSKKEDLLNLVESLENQVIPPLSIIISTNLAFSEAQELYTDLKGSNVDIRINISSEIDHEKLVQRVINKVHQKAEYVLICYPESTINPTIIETLSERYSNTSEVYLTYLSENFCLVDFDLLKLSLKMKKDEQNSIQFLMETKIGKFLYGTTISEDPTCYSNNSEL